MTPWIGSKYQIKFLQQYRSTPKVHCIYILEVPEDGVCKVGRSSRLKHRLTNLRACVWKQHTVHVIRCANAEESRDLDRYLKKALAESHRVGEFFNCSHKDVEETVARSPFSHLSFSDERAMETEPLYKPDTRTKSANYDVVIS